jgi:hypothetical protein
MALNRVLSAYAIVLVATLLFLGRRLVLPTDFDVAGMPFEIAAASATNRCYSHPELSVCSDLIIVVPAIIGVTVASGRGHVLAMVFASLMGLLALALYLMLSSIYVVFATLLLTPLLIVGIEQLAFPR